MAQSPLDIRQTASEINAANTLLREGKVDEAIDAYRKVVPGEQQRDELNYNMAVAEYRKGNIETAEQLFANVAGTGSTTIAADSRYNLGNCQYAKALAAAEKDRSAAIELLREAIANYRGALRGNPNNPDARANIELAAELIRKLEQEQQQEEEQQKPDDQQQQKDEKQQDQQNKDQQQDKSQDSESQKSDSEKDKSQRNSDQQKNEEQMDEEQKKQDAADQSQKDEQKKDEQKNDKAGDKEEKNDQQKPSDQQSQPQSSDSQQKQQQKSGDQGKPEDEGQSEDQDARNQPVPTGDLKAASEQEQNKKPEGTVGMADPNAKDGLMTREEAMKMLQSVRDRDMLRRMQQQRQER